MIDIKLNDSQTGYDVMGDYIRRYWEHDGIETVIFEVALSHDGESYSVIIGVAKPMNGYDIEFLDDWWEGEKYIYPCAIASLDTLEIFGGIYED